MAVHGPFTVAHTAGNLLAGTEGAHGSRDRAAELAREALSGAASPAHRTTSLPGPAVPAA